MRTYNPPTAFFMEVQTFDPHSLDFPRAEDGATRRPFAAIADMVWVNRSVFLLFASTAFFIFSLSAFLFSLPSKSVVAKGAITPVSAAATNYVRPLEIHIANDGLVLLRSARVVAVQGSTITLSTAWGSSDFRWIVHTNASSYETRNFGTSFIGSDGQKISLGDVQVGGLVTVTGMLDNAAQEPTLDANSIRSLE